MRTKGSIHFRFYLILLFFLIYLICMVVTVSYFALYRLPRLENKNRFSVRSASEDLKARFEILLNAVLEKTEIFVMSCDYLDRETIDLMIREMTDPSDIKSVILVDDRGIVVSAVSQEASYQDSSRILGNDLSYNPLYMEVLKEGGPVWSDKYLSQLAGDSTIAVAVPGRHFTAIAEVSWEYIQSTLQLARSEDYLSVWIIDKSGDMVADTEGIYTPGVDNLMWIDFVRQALKEDIFIPRQSFKRRNYHLSSNYSDSLGWVFLTRVPVGLEHPDIYSRMTDLVILLLVQFLLILVITPLVASPISMSMIRLAEYAQRIADQSTEAPWVPHRVSELNTLAANLRYMAGEVYQREASLRDLNKELENRVKQRTRELKDANSELQQSLNSLNRMKDELVEAEKLSALGSLVAGISHELNTPLGNALMAVSAMMEQHRNFKNIQEGELTVNALEKYLEHIGTGLSISHRNLEKSSELVSSFKQVAVDQTSSKRRTFSLEEMLSDLLLTLQPLMKRSPVRIVRNLQSGINMNSYPGMLGQIITNLINNAVIHGYGGDQPGEIFLTSESLNADRVVITVRDNGKGMSEEVLGKVFEPFFTTRQNEGGSGLGLSIAINGVKQILGGTIEVDSKQGEGTVFRVNIPVNAPHLTEEAE